ncbi:MAG: hypothetical protein Q8S00_04030 [Deltaproteobacteria bacterium]|nr:hypothetical protein [Deltaproteobacteria bacterium]
MGELHDRHEYGEKNEKPKSHFNHGLAAPLAQNIHSHKTTPPLLRPIGKQRRKIVKKSAPLPMCRAHPLSAQYYGTNCAKEFAVTGDKSCVFFNCFTEQKICKIELRAAP